MRYRVSESDEEFLVVDLDEKVLFHLKKSQANKEIADQIAGNLNRRLNFGENGRPKGKIGLSRHHPVAAKSRLTPEQVQSILERGREGFGPWRIAGDLWQDLGYHNHNTCYKEIRKILQRAEVI